MVVGSKSGVCEGIVLWVRGVKDCYVNCVSKCGL